MVEGCKTLNATVIDLDGTFVTCNSLVAFTRFALSMSVCRLRLVKTLKIAVAVAARKLRLISHRAMKHRILRVAETFIKSADVSAFVDELLERVNPEVEAIADANRRDGHLLVLATAAPELYASELAKRFGFDAYVATPMTSRLSDYVETRGREKLRRVTALLETRGATLHTAISDHQDDAPLLSAAFNPILLQ